MSESNFGVMVSRTFYRYDSLFIPNKPNDAFKTTSFYLIILFEVFGDIEQTIFQKPFRYVGLVAPVNTELYLCYVNVSGFC